MTRKALVKTNLYPYHLTGRANNRECFFLPMDNVWKIFCDELSKLQQNHDLKIHQFVLMKNHYHLLAETPNFNIDKIMYFLQKNVAAKINQQAFRINHVFGGPYRWSLVMKDSYVKNVIRYIFQNPLRANLVERAEDYPFSTLFYKKRNLALPFHHDFSSLIDTADEAHFLEFMNQSFTREQESRIKMALTFTHFKIAKSSKNGRSPFAEHTV